MSLATAIRFVFGLERLERDFRQLEIVLECGPLNFGSFYIGPVVGKHALSGSVERSSIFWIEGREGIVTWTLFWT